MSTVRFDNETVDARAGERASHAGMVLIPGGAFRMGSDKHYPEEAPVHRVTVDSFFIDRTPVTNRQFKEFVKATGYVTFAEIPPNPKDYPGALPHMLYAGSLVFSPPSRPVDLRNWGEWWTFLKGADWRHPYGPKSNINNLENHPVVHVSFADALAYARWAGKDLPTEAEWEYAARGGLDGAEYAWGDEFTPGGKHQANTWQGEFPRQNLNDDGFERTSPVTAFPPNGYDVHDMIGNTWEWTTDWYAQKHDADAPKACCVPENPRGGREEGSYDPCQPNIKIPRKVIKGGSHLCAPNYCRRYRPAARHAEAVDTSTSHLGFRCVKRSPAVFTASVTSALTSSQIQGTIRGVADLTSVRVGTVKGTAAVAALARRQIEFERYPTIQDGLNALRSSKIDAFIYDKPLLAWSLRQKYSYSVRLLDIVFEPQEYAFVLPSDSALRKPLSVAILDALQSDEWTEMKVRYPGPAAANSP